MKIIGYRFKCIAIAKVKLNSCSPSPLMFDNEFSIGMQTTQHMLSMGFDAMKATTRAGIYELFMFRWRWLNCNPMNASSLQLETRAPITVSTAISENYSSGRSTVVHVHCVRLFIVWISWPLVLLQTLCSMYTTQHWIQWIPSEIQTYFPLKTEFI